MKYSLVVEFILAHLEFKKHEKQIIIHFKYCRK